jgi:Putative zinc-finger
MKHPERDEWVPFLFGEATLETKKRLSAHLKGCPECAAELEGWQRSLGRLEKWELPSGSPHGAPGLAPAFRWAAAAAVVVCAGFAAGRLTSAPGITQANLRAEVQAAVDSATTQTTDAVAALENRIARVSEAQSRQLLEAFSQVFDQAREQDRTSILAVLQRVEREHAADYVALRSDLETVASAADKEIRDARRSILQLATNDQPDQPE